MKVPDVNKDVNKGILRREEQVCVNDTLCLFTLENGRLLILLKVKLPGKIICSGFHSLRRDLLCDSKLTLKMMNVQFLLQVHALFWRHLSDAWINANSG